MYVNYAHRMDDTSIYISTKFKRRASRGANVTFWYLYFQKEKN